MNGYIISFKHPDGRWYSETIISENISSCKKIKPKKGFKLDNIIQRHNIYVEPKRNELLKKYFELKKTKTYEYIWDYFNDIYEKFFEFYGLVDASTKDKRIYNTLLRIIIISGRRMSQNDI